jgi:CHAT domain-containing protein
MPSRDDDPLGAGLKLSDERGRPTRLTVTAMLSSRADDICGTVVLAGCSSLGADSVGTGEWWGAACGLLRQGSNYVVGSQWNVAHCAANVAFVVELINELRVQPDAPAALCDVQRRWLRAWQQSPDEPLAVDTVVAHPLIWTAYSVVGMARGLG